MSDLRRKKSLWLLLTLLQLLSCYVAHLKQFVLACSLKAHPSLARFKLPGISLTLRSTSHSSVAK